MCPNASKNVQDAIQHETRVECEQPGPLYALAVKTHFLAERNIANHIIPPAPANSCELFLSLHNANLTIMIQKQQRIVEH